MRNKLWWEGPDWLTQDKATWPKPRSVQASEPEPQEVRVNLVSTNLTSPIINVTDYSTLERLVRVTAWTFRFINQIKKKETKLPTQLTAEELTEAELYHIKAVQKEDFREDLSKLKTRQQVATSSSIASLIPIVDSCGILRVGGRLANADVTPDCKHPIILKGKNYLSKLIIKKEHHRLLHAGPSATFSSLSR